MSEPAAHSRQYCSRHMHAIALACTNAFTECRACIACTLRAVGDEVRKEKEAMSAMRAELQARRLQRAKDLKDQAKAQLELDKEIKKKEEEKRLEIGKEQRAKEAAWQERREQQAQAFVMKGHKLVEETRQRQKNMDKAEDEQDKKERAEGLAEKKRILEAYKKEKAENYEENKVKVQSVKKATDPAIIAEAKKWASEQRVGSAEDKRKQFSALKSMRRRKKEGHLEKAKEIKGKVEEIKQAAREVHKKMLEKKKKNAGEERANDYLVELEKQRVLAQKQKEHDSIYNKRYASTKAAAKWEQAPVLAKPNFGSLDPSISGGGLVG